MYRIGLLILLVATPAAAQTTTCGEEFGKWVCRQQRPANVDSYWFGAERQREAGEALGAAAGGAVASMRRREEEAAGRRLEEDRQARRDSFRRRLGGLMGEGKCDEAKSVALTEGDFDLAREVVSLCRSTTP